MWKAVSHLVLEVADWWCLSCLKQLANSATIVQTGFMQPTGFLGSWQRPAGYRGCIWIGLEKLRPFTTSDVEILSLYPLYIPHYDVVVSIFFSIIPI